MAAFVAAYHATEALAEEEILLLPDLIATRHAMILAIAAWRTSLHPHDAAYINRNAGAARAGLAALGGAGRSRAQARFLAACRRPARP
jgi:Ser/Thr protein kinase RdoA (MazF antagonist)